MRQDKQIGFTHVGEVLQDFVQDLYPTGKLPESWFDENVRSYHPEDAFIGQEPCYNQEKERCY